MKQSLKQSFNMKFFLVFAVIAIVFFLAIGMPQPPGLLYKASESYLQSLPGYHDVKTGSINPALLEQNIDSYNSYLTSVVVLITLNLIVYYLLYILANVVIWNYIQTNNLSVKGYWKSFLFNIMWILLSAFVAVLSYGAFTFVGSIGAVWWNVLMSFMFIVSLALIGVVTLLCNYHLHKSGLILESVVSAFDAFKKNFWKLIAGLLLIFVAVIIFSMLFYVPAVTFDLATAIVTIVQLAGLAWMHSYIAVLVESKEKKSKH